MNFFSSKWVPWSPFAQQDHINIVIATVSWMLPRSTVSSILPRCPKCCHGDLSPTYCHDFLPYIAPLFISCLFIFRSSSWGLACSHLFPRHCWYINWEWSIHIQILGTRKRISQIEDWDSVTMPEFVVEYLNFGSDRVRYDCIWIWIFSICETELYIIAFEQASHKDFDGLWVNSTMLDWFIFMFSPNQHSWINSTVQINICMRL